MTRRWEDAWNSYLEVRLTKVGPSKADLFNKMGAEDLQAGLNTFHVLPGCHENANNFDSKDDCAAACERRPPENSAPANTREELAN